jgi:hypothetical protein
MSARHRRDWVKYRGILCLWLVGVNVAQADGFAFFRYDDDFTYLSDPSKRASWYDEIKYLPLGDDASRYLSIGGDLRERVESYSDGYFGLADAPHTTYLLSRALLDADLHWEDFRAFVQLGNAVEWNREPAALPTDNNRGDVQQAFIDYAPLVGPGQATVRLGRFELKFGEGLIVSPRDGPNIRQAWDGGWAFFTMPGWRVDVLAVRPVEDKAGWFEDTANPAQQLWGAYVTATPAPLKDYAVDAYYFNNINHAVAFYAGTPAPGSEHTQTTGGRFYGHLGGFDSTSEAALQTGSFNTRAVHAFAIHNELGWTFGDLPGTPRFGLKADVLSGSRDPLTGAVHTFNALYPNYSYGTEAVLEAPSNLIEAGTDLHVYPNPAVDFQYTGAGLWRYSTRDAFYAAPLFPLIPGGAGNQRYVGMEHQLAGNWRVNRFVTMRATLVHYSAGQFVIDARGRDTNFGMLYVATRF